MRWCRQLCLKRTFEYCNDEARIAIAVIGIERVDPFPPLKTDLVCFPSKVLTVKITGGFAEIVEVKLDAAVFQFY